MKSLGLSGTPDIKVAATPSHAHRSAQLINLSGKIGQVIWPLLLLFACCVIVSGCSHSRESELREFGPVGTYEVEPPTFLTGPMGVLLTNAAGYSAHANIQNESLGGGGPQGVTAGELFCRGSKLLFAPATTEPKKKKTPGGGFAFIWDVARGSGYVLSGALQAYAPVSTSVRVTNVVRDAANATVQMNDGKATTFQVLPTADSSGVPARISGTGDRMPLAVSLSNIRPGAPPEDVFIPADDFSKYSNPEAMAEELAARQRNLRRRIPTDFEPIEGRLRTGNQPQ